MYHLQSKGHTWQKVCFAAHLTRVVGCEGWQLALSMWSLTLYQHRRQRDQFASCEMGSRANTAWLSQPPVSPSSDADMQALGSSRKEQVTAPYGTPYPIHLIESSQRSRYVWLKLRFQGGLGMPLRTTWETWPNDRPFSTASIPLTSPLISPGHDKN